MDSKLLLSIPEAANALGVSRGTIYNLFETGSLRRVKIGAATRITSESVRSLAGIARVSA
jgi:excisionase family DNA binding protein